MQDGDQRALTNSPTGRDALQIVPAQDASAGQVPRVRLANPEEILVRSTEAQLAIGPPWVIGYLLYDGRHPALAEYFRHNRRILGKAAGEEILLVGVGHPRHFDEVFEELAGDELLDHYKAKMLPIYERLVRELDGRVDVAIEGTEQLAELLQVERDRLPCIHFLSHPRTVDDASIWIPPALVDSVAKQRQVTEVLIPELERARSEDLFEDGMSNEEVMEKLRGWTLSVESTLLDLAPHEHPPSQEGWRRYPGIGNVRYHRGRRVLEVQGSEYPLGSQERAAVIEVLLEHQGAGLGPIKHEKLMAKAKQPKIKIQHVFKNHPLLVQEILRAPERGHWRLEG